MKIKKLMIIALCAALVLSLFTGCAKKDDESDPTATGDVSQSRAEKIYGFFNPDDIIMTVDGRNVYWKDYFYFLNLYIAELEYYFGEIEDWQGEFEPGMTFEEYALTGAEAELLFGAAAERGAAELGLYPKEEEMRAIIETEREASVETYGGEEAFKELLAQNYCTEEFYEYFFLKINWLSQSCFKELYGENAEKLSNEEIADYIANDGYMQAKHILRKTVTENDEPLPDKEKAEVRIFMEDILEQLNHYEGEDFSAFFDSLMWRHSEDTGGMQLYPDGYLFQPNEMVPAFEDAWSGLKDGEYSGLVETDYGYHIVYRMPINYDETPYSHASQKQAGSDGYTLRKLSAMGMFGSIINGWKAQVEVVYSEEYKAFDFMKILAG